MTTGESKYLKPSHDLLIQATRALKTQNRGGIKDQTYRVYFLDRLQVIAISTAVSAASIDEQAR